MSVQTEAWRNAGKRTLETTGVLSTRQIVVWEKVIFDQTGSQQEYKRAVFQTVGDLIAEKKPTKVLAGLKRGEIGWKHEVWKPMARRIEEQNEFITNPFEVEEGVFECKARGPDGKVCGSKKVLSHSKQDRASDEQTSVYCQCVTCGASWRAN